MAEPPAAPPEDDTDKRRKLTDEQRQQKERTNAGNRDDLHTEGTIVAIRLSLADPIPVPKKGFIVQPDAVPYLLIENKDGVEEIELIGDAAKSALSIHVDDYVEADGSKESEELFIADDLSISRK